MNDDKEKINKMSEEECVRPRVLQWGLICVSGSQYIDVVN